MTTLAEAGSAELLESVSRPCEIVMVPVSVLAAPRLSVPGAGLHEALIAGEHGVDGSALIDD